MDFGALPPEINSARIYTGPGPGPMLAAAAAWDALAEQLYFAAIACHSIVEALTTGPWLGAASTSMAAATAPYVAWMTSTATQAEKTAAQARMAATAYETALSMTVPPPLIAANRAQLLALIATNVLGQITPAIAATEADYAQMWAQDAATMYAYAGNSAIAATLTPFTSPQPGTNPAGLAGQLAVATHAAGATTTNTQAALSQLTSTIPQALQNLAAPLQPPSGPTAISSLTPLMQAGYYPVSMVSSGLSGMSSLSSTMRTLAPTTQAVGSEAKALESATSVLGSTGLAGPGAGAAGGAAVSAGVGRAGSLGALSVPPIWATSAAGISPAAAAVPATSTLSAAPAAPAATPDGMLGGLPMATSAWRRVGGPAPRPEPRITIAPRSPVPGYQNPLATAT